jgi:hypothetical protein
MIWIRFTTLEATLFLLMTTETLLPQTYAADVTSIGQEKQYIFSLKRGAEKTASKQQSYLIMDNS